jgi:hypothetical protein
MTHVTCGPDMLPRQDGGTKSRFVPRWGMNGEVPDPPAGFRCNAASRPERVGQSP